MGRFRITRNNNKDVKQLLQAKLDSSLIEEVHLLCKWSGNEKNCVITELLRYAISQESEFQKYKQSLPRGSAPEATTMLAAESERREPVRERKVPPATLVK